MSKNVIYLDDIAYLVVKYCSLHLCFDCILSVGWDWLEFVGCKISLEMGSFIFICGTILKNIKF